MIFEFDGVTKLTPPRKSGRARRIIFDDLSFGMPSTPMTIAILGPRFTGKTTLSNLIVGADFPDEGSVRRHGNVSFPVASPAVINGFMTGQECAGFIARLYGLKVQRFCDEVEDLTGLGEVFRHRVQTYNTDEKANLRFAISYLVPFDCYVVDGVMVGGTFSVQERLERLVRMRQRASSFFFITRSPRDVLTWANAAGVIMNNGIVMFPTLEEAIEAYRLESLKVEGSSGTATEEEDEEEEEEGGKRGGK